MVFLIVTMMSSALSVVFYCYAVDLRALLFLIVTMMISARCLVFVCYDDD